MGGSINAFKLDDHLQFLVDNLSHSKFFVEVGEQLANQDYAKIFKLFNEKISDVKKEHVYQSFDYSIFNKDSGHSFYELVNQPFEYIHLYLIKNEHYDSKHSLKGNIVAIEHILPIMKDVSEGNTNSALNYAQDFARHSFDTGLDFRDGNNDPEAVAKKIIESKQQFKLYVVNLG